MGWMVLAVANMVQEKMGSDMTDDGREGTKRGRKDNKEFAVDCGTRKPVYHLWSNVVLASIHAGER